MDNLAFTRTSEGQTPVIQRTNNRQKGLVIYVLSSLIEMHGEKITN